MEASETAAPEAAQEAPEAQTAPEGEKPSIPEQLLERFDGFRTEVTDRFGQLEQRLPEKEQEQEPEAPRYFRDELTGELLDHQGQLVDEGQIRDQRLMSQVQEMVKPMQETLQRQQEQLQDYEVGAVMDEFPALEDPKVSEPFMQGVQQIAEQMGAPQLAHNPEFIRSQWLAKLGEERAAQETPAGAPELGGSVETGAASVAQVPEDPAKAILDSARGGGSERARQFWDG